MKKYPFEKTVFITVAMVLALYFSPSLVFAKTAPDIGEDNPAELRAFLDGKKAEYHKERQERRTERKKREHIRKKKRFSER
jgi:hypothetical protein